MAYSVIIRRRVLAVFFVWVFLCCCNLGKGKGDDVASATGPGIVVTDPAQIVAKALLCFNDKSIYSSCEEAYRLTETGNLDVPPDHVDPYCSGPCLKETTLVLNCIENIMTNFLFYNKATINDIRDTIKAGCSYGAERGKFNVAEHLQAVENNAVKKTTNQNYQILFGLGVMILGKALFL